MADRTGTSEAGALRAEFLDRWVRAEARNEHTEAFPIPEPYASEIDNVVRRERAGELTAAQARRLWLPLLADAYVAHHTDPTRGQGAANR